MAAARPSAAANQCDNNQQGDDEDDDSEREIQGYRIHVAKSDVLTRGCAVGRPNSLNHCYQLAANDLPSSLV